MSTKHITTPDQDHNNGPAILTNGSHELYRACVDEALSSKLHDILTVRAGQPLYRRLADALVRTDLNELPPARVLAGELGINRATVAAAYHELASRSGLSVRRGRPRRHGPPDERGPSAQDDRSAAEIDLASYSPDHELLPPGHIFRWLGLGESEGESGVAQYGDSRGYPPLREWIANRLAGLGVPCSPETVVLTGGVQHGLDLILRSLTRARQTILVEDPTYPGLPPLIALHGLRPRPVRARCTGLDPVEVADALHPKPPTAAILTPTLHNPTGLVLSDGCRKAILTTLLGAGVTVIEEFFDPAMVVCGPIPPPLAALDSRVILVGSFSKALFPGLRVGWITGPPAVVAKLRSVKECTDLSGSPFLEATAFALCQRGVLEQQFARLRAAARQRGEVVVCGLANAPGCRTSVPRGGFTVLVELPPGKSAREMTNRAARLGVRVLPGPAMSFTGADDILRLTFAAVGGERLRQAVDRLASALASDALHAPLV